jgi:hypothetical protein
VAQGHVHFAFGYKIGTATDKRHGLEVTRQSRSGFDTDSASIRGGILTFRSFVSGRVVAFPVASCTSKHMGGAQCEKVAVGPRRSKSALFPMRRSLCLTTCDGTRRYAIVAA